MTTLTPHTTTGTISKSDYDGSHGIEVEFELPATLQEELNQLPVGTKVTITLTVRTET